MGAAESKGGPTKDLFSLCEPHKQEGFSQAEGSAYNYPHSAHRPAAYSSSVYAPSERDSEADDARSVAQSMQYAKSVVSRQSSVIQSQIQELERAASQIFQNSDCMSHPIPEGAKFHLHRCAQKGDDALDRAEALLKNGAAVDCQDAYMRTALHVAVKRSAFKLIWLLLSHGASTEIKNLDGKSAVQLSVEAGSINVTALLEMAGSAELEEDEDLDFRDNHNASRDRRHSFNSAGSTRSWRSEKEEETIRIQFEQRLPGYPSDIDQLLSTERPTAKIPMRNQLLKAASKEFEETKQRQRNVVLNKSDSEIMHKKRELRRLLKAHGKLKTVRHKYPEIKEEVMEGEWDPSQGYVGKHVEDPVDDQLVKVEMHRHFRNNGIYSLDKKRRVYSNSRTRF